MSDLVGPIKLRRGTEAHILAITTAALGEPFYSTDTGKLFVGGAAGVPVPVSSGGVRSSVTYTTASLAAGATETGSFTVPKAYSILRLVNTYPAWVRVYLSSAQRDADLARASNVDPTGDHGCILETITTAGMLTLDLSPVAVGASPTDGTVAYITVTNLDTVALAVATTLSLLSMEG